MDDFHTHNIFDSKSIKASMTTKNVTLVYDCPNSSQIKDGRSPGIEYIWINLAKIK